MPAFFIASTWASLSPSIFWQADAITSSLAFNIACCTAGDSRFQRASLIA